MYNTEAIPFRYISIHACIDAIILSTCIYIHNIQLSMEINTILICMNISLLHKASMCDIYTIDFFDPPDIYRYNAFFIPARI